MTINYIILAHKNPNQFQRLVRRLNAKNVFFYVHIDKSVDDGPFKSQLTELKNVFFLCEEERVITAWSDFSFSEAIRTSLTKCCKNVQKNAYCVLLSGQDYPLKSNKSIYRFLKENYGKNYISYDKANKVWPSWRDRLERYNFHLPSKRMNKGIYPLVDRRCYSFQNMKNLLFLIWHVGLGTSLKTLFRNKRKHPVKLEPFGGSTWCALPIETVKEVVGHLEEHVDLWEYHRYSHVPDEILFHSLINKLKPEDKIANSTTYVNWSRKNITLPVTFRITDFDELVQLEDCYLFARKFDEFIDSTIMDSLDEKIDSEQ